MSSIGEFLFAFFLSIVFTAFSFVAPFLVQKILQYLEAGDQDTVKGYWLVGYLVGSQTAAYVFSQHILYFQVMIGTRSSNALVALIYQKLHKLTPSTNKQYDSGQIVNFVQVDAGTLFWLCFQMTDIMQIPLVLIYAFTYLFMTLGVSFLSGVGVFVLAFIANAFVGLKLQKLNESLMARKDERMNCTNEAITNIKTLKFYSWVTIYEQEIRKRREAELQRIKVLMAGWALMITSLYFFPSILSSVVLSTYIGTNHTIDLPTTFTVLVFFNMIQGPIRQLPLFLGEFIEFQVSMRRIQKFIDIKEVPADCLVQSDPMSDLAVSIENQSFTWGVKAEEADSKKKKKKPKDHARIVSSRTPSLRVPAENAVHEPFEAEAEEELGFGEELVPAAGKQKLLELPTGSESETKKQS